MTPTDDYGEYEQYDGEEDQEVRRTYRRQRAPVRYQDTWLARQAFDWGISGSILAILLLTLVPDLIPFAGLADDIAAVLSGGSSVVFLAILRYALRTRVGRLGCLITIVLASIGAFTVFWILLQIFDRLL